MRAQTGGGTSVLYLSGEDGVADELSDAFYDEGVALVEEDGGRGGGPPAEGYDAVIVDGYPEKEFPGTYVFALVEEPTDGVHADVTDYVVKRGDWVAGTVNRVENYLSLGEGGVEGVDGPRETGWERAVIENFPGAVLVFDDDLRYTLAGGKSISDVGLSVEEMEGSTLKEVFPERVWREQEGHYRDALRGKTRTFEQGYEGRHYRLRTAPLRVGSDDEVVLGMVVVQDVTEKKEAEEELRIKTRALEKAGASFCFTDPRKEDNPIVYVNEGFERLTGYSEDESIGRNCRFLQGEETDEEAVSRIRRAVEEGESKEEELLNYKKDGTPFWNKIHISPVHDEDGEIIRYVGSQRDVTELKESKRNLERTNTRLRRLNSGLDRMASSGSVQEVRDAMEGVFEGLGTCDCSYYYWSDDGALAPSSDGCDGGVPRGAKDAYYSGKRVERGGGVHVPVGDDGVLSVRTDGAADARIGDLVESVVSSAEGAIRRLEGRREVLELTEEVEEKNKGLEELAETNDAVRGVLRDIPLTDDTDSMYRSLCDDLTEVEGWDFGWVAEREGRGYGVRAATDRYFAERLSVASEPDASPVGKAFEGEACFVEDVAKQPTSRWREAVLGNGYASAASVPVSDSGEVFAALEVYSKETRAFSGKHAEVLADAARILGYAVSSERVRRLAVQPSSTTVRLLVPTEDHPLRRVAERCGGAVSVMDCTPAADGYVFRLEPDTERPTDALDPIPLADDDADGHVRVEVPSVGVVEAFQRYAAQVKSISSHPEGTVFELAIPAGVRLREVLEAVSEPFPGTRVLYKSGRAPDGSTDSVLDGVTERQKEVLRTAYEQGFFETPKEATGEEVAESLGISPPTVHHHLRSAERSIIGRIF